MDNFILCKTKSWQKKSLHYLSEWWNEAEELLNPNVKKTSNCIVAATRRYVTNFSQNIFEFNIMNNEKTSLSDELSHIMQSTCWDAPGDFQNPMVQTPLATPEQVAGSYWHHKHLDYTAGYSVKLCLLFDRQLHPMGFCAKLPQCKVTVCLSVVVGILLSLTAIPRDKWIHPKLSSSCDRSVSEHATECMMLRLCNLWCNLSNMWYGSIWRYGKEKKI